MTLCYNWEKRTEVQLGTCTLKGETVDVNTVRRATAYEWSVGILGSAAVGCTIPALWHQNLWMVLIVFLLAILINAVPVPFGKVEGSLLISLPVGLTLVYDASVAAWAIYIATLVYPWLTYKQMRLSTVVFNAGQYALSSLACSAVIGLFQSELTPGTFGWWTLLAGGVGSGVFLVVNHALVQSLNWLNGQFEVQDAWRVFWLDTLNLVIGIPLTALFITIAPKHPVIAVLIMLPTVVLGITLRNYHHLTYLQQAHVVTTQLVAEFDVDRISEAVAKTAAGMTYAEAVAVYVLNEERDRLLPSVIYPLHTSSRFDLAGLSRADGGLVWHVLYGEGMVYVPDVTRDRRVRPEESAGYRSLAVFPMRTPHDVHGVIVCYSSRPYAFGEMREYVWTLARQVGVLFENAKLYQELQDLSVRDGATGLYNYRFFYDALERKLREAEAAGGRLSVAVVDVDSFKKFNDTYGHLAGDTVLRSVGRLLAQMAGPESVVARYGGEEFALILPLSGVSAYEWVEQMREAVAGHVVEYEGHALPTVTVSCGIASYPEHGRDGRELLLKADSAMYWGAKQRGRNRTVLYTSEFEADLFVDSGSGLYTVHFLSLRLREDFALGDTGWGILCMAFDSLTGLKDALGSSALDPVMREVGTVVRDCLRQTDLACRYADDVIVVAVPGGTHDELRVIGERIVNALSTHAFRGGGGLAIRVQPRYAVSVFRGTHDADQVLHEIRELVTRLRPAGESLA